MQGLRHTRRSLYAQTYAPSLPSLLKALLTSLPEIRLDNFEMIFLRLLHLLAHHPDFSISDEGLPDMAK